MTDELKTGDTVRVSAKPLLHSGQIGTVVGRATIGHDYWRVQFNNDIVSDWFVFRQCELELIDTSLSVTGK